MTQKNYSSDPQDNESQGTGGILSFVENMRKNDIFYITGTMYFCGGFVEIG